jgi:hypothetical protein
LGLHLTDENITPVAFNNLVSQIGMFWEYDEVLGLETVFSPGIRTHLLDGIWTGCTTTMQMNWVCRHQLSVVGMVDHGCDSARNFWALLHWSSLVHGGYNLGLRVLVVYTRDRTCLKHIQFKFSRQKKLITKNRIWLHRVTGTQFTETTLY